MRHFLSTLRAAGACAKLHTPTFPAMELQLQALALGVNTAPLVSCLLVSNGDLPALQNAVDQFLAQNYAKRELIIGLQPDQVEAIAWLTKLQEPHLHAHVLPFLADDLAFAIHHLAANARGEWLCIWQQDEWHSPQRITEQLSASIATHSAICVLQQVLLCAPAKQRLGLGHYCNWPTTALVHKEAWAMLTPRAGLDDSEWLTRLGMNYRIVELRAPWLYIIMDVPGRALPLDFAELWHRAALCSSPQVFGEILSVLDINTSRLLHN